MFVLYSIALAYFLLWFCFSYVGIQYHFSNFFSLNNVEPLFMSAHTDQLPSFELPFSDMYYGCTIHPMECSKRFFFFSFYNYGCSKKDLVQISLYTFRTIVVSDKWDCWVNRYYTYFRLKGFPKLDTKRLYALDINLNFFFSD